QRSGERTRLIQMWASEFQRIYPKVRVALDDSGFDDVGDHPAIWGPWLGEKGKFTRKQFEKRFGAQPIGFPVCWYVLAVHVRKDCPLGDKLLMKEVETIFSFYRWDATWGDLGCEGEWFKRRIVPYAPGPYRFATQDMIRRHCKDPRIFSFKDTMKRPEGDAFCCRDRQSG
ncbi:MAG: hypothetical protein QNK17_10230, partial [Hyphomicrobiaceae bacterium]|nr:hypothetical protein [Hyphomicrobiaceae bacterium]MDX2450785.1 hypothetical protein [Hyphomicrobiaceae bacterium]